MCVIDAEELFRPGCLGSLGICCDHRSRDIPQPTPYGMDGARRLSPRCRDTTLRMGDNQPGTPASSDTAGTPRRSGCGWCPLRTFTGERAFACHGGPWSSSQGRRPQGASVCVANSGWSARLCLSPVRALVIDHCCFRCDQDSRGCALGPPVGVPDPSPCPRWRPGFDARA